MSNILDRRRTHFMLWCPTGPIDARALINRPYPQRQSRELPVSDSTDAPARDQYRQADAGLWQLAAIGLGLTDGETYHYWFEVDNSYPGITATFRSPTPWLRVSIAGGLAS